jgi:parvulin-like peptidyl-prolyl isomerase
VTRHPRRRGLRLAPLLLAAAAASPAWAQPAPSRAAAPSEATLLARRGDLSLTEAALREMLEREPPERREALLRDPAALGQYVRQRMLRLALLEEAKAQRFDQRPEAVARAEQARQEAIAEAFLESLSRPDPAWPPEPEVQTVYDANRTRFMVPRQYRLAQIFLAVPAGAPKDAEEAAQRRLREWRTQAVATNPRQRTDFAELARRHSEDRASAPRGGALDWIREDRLVEPIRGAVAGLEEGAVSEPIRTEQGWHLIRVEATRPAGPAPLAEVRDSIIALMRQQRTQELSRQALNEMLRREPIMIDEIQLGRLAAAARPATPGGGVAASATPPRWGRGRASSSACSPRRRRPPPPPPAPKARPPPAPAWTSASGRNATTTA